MQVCGLYPFSVGSSLPMVGAALGPHLEGRGTVCGDPIAWFLANLISNPSAFILGRPGLGKSSLIRHLLPQLVDKGVIPMILSDLKPDYVPIIRQIGGQVIRLGRSTGHLNPLDPGPMAALLDRLSPPARAAAKKDLAGRRMNLMEGLCELALRRRLQAHESNVLGAVISLWEADHPGQVPLIRELQVLVQDRPARLRAIVQDRGDDDRYDDRVEGLVDALIGLGGQGERFGTVFADHTTEQLQMHCPVVYDLSDIEGADEALQAACQLVCWSSGSAAVAASTALAAEGLAPRRVYLMVMDELWRALRAAAFMVDRIDEITRLNRQLGLGQVLCTHTMADLELPSAADTKKAWGFVERSSMVFLGGLAEGEMGNLEKVFGMSRKERAMITDWSIPESIDPESGEATDPPGRGKFLLKIGRQTGIPFQVQLVAAEIAANDTNTSWRDTRAAMRRTGTALHDVLVDEYGTEPDDQPDHTGNELDGETSELGQVAAVGEGVR